MDNRPIGVFDSGLGGLTTVRQDFYLTGYMAGKAIYEKIEGKTDVHVDNMMYELVIRGSAKGRL